MIENYAVQARSNANNKIQINPLFLKNYSKKEIEQIEKLFTNGNDLNKILQSHKIEFVNGRLNIKSLFFKN